MINVKILKYSLSLFFIHLSNFPGSLLCAELNKMDVVISGPKGLQRLFGGERGEMRAEMKQLTVK